MLNRILLCGFAVLCFWCGSVAANPRCLDDTRIRLREAIHDLHREEENPVLAVRAFVTAWASDALNAVGDVDAAREYLDRLKTFAGDTLVSAGYSNTGLLSFCREVFSAWKNWPGWKFFFGRNELSLFFGRKM